MTNAQRKPTILLTDEEEAQIQAGIATDPENPELTDEELASMRPAKEVLPPALYAALTGTVIPSPKREETVKKKKRELYRRAGRSALEVMKSRHMRRKKRARSTIKKPPSKQTA